MPAKGTVIMLAKNASDMSSHHAEGTAEPNGGGVVVGRRDVDLLVHEIKENLKLGHGYLGHHAGASGGGPFKTSRVGSQLSHHRHRSSHRSTPYQVPPSSRAGNCDSDGESSLKKWNHRRRYPSTCMSGAAAGNSGGGSVVVDKDDPFRMLQELITDGSLIKEAVRRLQLGLGPKLGSSKVNDRRKSFYDSDDDDCRTPTQIDLCCETSSAAGRM